MVLTELFLLFPWSEPTKKKTRKRKKGVATCHTWIAFSNQWALISSVQDILFQITRMLKTAFP